MCVCVILSFSSNPQLIIHCVCMQCEMLYQRLGRALSLDNASCGILAGDIGEDSIIVRAQQLVNMEVSNSLFVSKAPDDEINAMNILV